MLNNIWFILPQYMPQILRAIDGPRLTHPQVTEEVLHAASTAISASAPGRLQVVNGSDEARIRIAGPLLPTRSEWLDYFGVEHTAYQDIISSVQSAASDPRIKSLVTELDTPGGLVAGLNEATAAYASFPKPKRAVASLAASAGYALAANAGPIEAASEYATFGSIGVVATYFPNDRAVDVTSSAAPDKRPDPRTPEGKAVIQAYLDEIHALFAEDIGRGRGISAKKVDANYGGGRVFLAAESLKRGLIDSIAGQSNKRTTNRVEKAQTMDRETLKAEHPKLYQEVFDLGATAGKTTEQKRCADHLRLGAVSPGAMAVALEAIKGGASPEDCYAQYLECKMMQTASGQRAEGEQQVTQALGGTNVRAGADTKDESAAVAAIKAQMTSGGMKLA